MQQILATRKNQAAAMKTKTKVNLSHFMSVLVILVCVSI